MQINSPKHCTFFKCIKWEYDFFFSFIALTSDLRLYRAVVWTDFIQFILMLAAIITIVTLGANNVGGFSNVWSAAERGGRLNMFK